ncbi:MAG: hypothetical protein EON91_00390 [Brevundimonas sp.]|nr:MAG: hypothetical protein EON91_00390 [Brevundimonas sp.]
MFQWSDGFHAFTVAASSRPKALAAWGVSQDLFATGLATEITRGPDFKAALESPQTVIARGLSVDVGRTRTKPVARSMDQARKAIKAAQMNLDQWQAAADLEQTEVAVRIAALEAEQKVMSERHDVERGRRKARIATLRLKAEAKGL